MPEDKKQDTKTPTAEAPAESTATHEITLTVADLRNL